MLTGLRLPAGRPLTQVQQLPGSGGGQRHQRRALRQQPGASTGQAQPGLCISHGSRGRQQVFCAYNAEGAIGARALVEPGQS